MTSENIKLEEYRDDRKYVPILINMLQSEALKCRAANEVCTYVYSAYKYRRIFYILTFLSIMFPAIVVGVNSMNISDNNVITILISMLSVFTVIVTGILSTMKAKESWIRNREYAERAKMEIFNCVMEMGEYKKTTNSEERIENERQLAERLEALFAEERGAWKSLRLKKDEDS